MRCLALLLLGVPLVAAALPVSAPRPGGIAVLALGESAKAPEVTFAGRPVLTISRDGHWHAVVGLPLDLSPGEATVLVDGEPRTIAVEPHGYREQHLTVQPSYVNPSAEALERIRREQRQVAAAIAHRSGTPPDGVLLAPPVPGSRSDSFGSRRFFNGEPRSPHRGMDLSGAEGTPVVAPRDGTVILAGDFYFTGKALFVDHGQGFVTLYAHLSRVDVAEGDRVAAGETLGAVGATGRVTGPHLHFATYLNGTPVDPALLLAD